MSSEFERELLKIAPFDLWRLLKTVREMITDNGFEIVEPTALVHLPFGPAFVQHLDQLKVFSRKHQQLTRQQTQHSKKKKTPAKSASEKAEKSSKSAANKDDSKHSTRSSAAEGKRSSSSKSAAKSGGRKSAGTSTSHAKDISHTNNNNNKRQLPKPSTSQDETMACFETTLTMYAIQRRPHTAVQEASPTIQPASLTTTTEDIKQKPTDATKSRMVVVFGRDKILGVNAVKQLVHFLKTAGAHHVVVLTKHGFTPFAQGPLGKLGAQFSIRTFEMDKMLINITHHILVKPHVRISDAERQRLVDRFRLHGDQIQQLPKLRRQDPVAMYHDFREGEIIKILSPGAPANYRLVV